MDKNSVVLISGCSSGIGLALARNSRRGVAVSSLQRENLRLLKI